MTPPGGQAARTLAWTLADFPAECHRCRHNVAQRRATVRRRPARDRFRRATRSPNRQGSRHPRPARLDFCAHDARSTEAGREVADQRAAAGGGFRAAFFCVDGGINDGVAESTRRVCPIAHSRARPRARCSPRRTRRLAPRLTASGRGALCSIALQGNALLSVPAIAAP
jgi:hypothetical protein